MKVLFYARHNSGEWFRYLASLLDGASSVVVSDTEGEGDVDLTPSFYRALHTTDTARVALAALGEPACAEIIARCRLLRSIDRALALRMLGAMWIAVDAVVEREAPDVAVSFPVDHYILDVLERALRQRGVRYIGFWDAIWPGLMMVTTRGQHTPLREPAADEVAAGVAALVQDEYVPHYVARGASHGLRRFLAPQLTMGARGGAFELLRRVRRNPLDFRYLATWAHVEEYRLGFGDWAYPRRLDARWRDKLDAVPFERRVFVGLQYNPEGTIDYAVEPVELIDYRQVLERLAARLSAAGYALFVKDHPAMFGLRQDAALRPLARFPGVTFVPYQVPARELIADCAATFTWTGTIGLEAALAGRCAIVAQGTWYAQPEAFLVLSSLRDLDALPERLAGWVPPADLPATRHQLVAHALGSCLPGSADPADFVGQRPPRTDRVAAMRQSLNALLPRLAARPTPLAAGPACAATG
jgi:hypothetical protein